ncbi:MAG: hypothetical protein R3E95_05495 [Thiolinea sp.]
MHLTAGDGYATMGDGTPRYIFGFADVSGLPTKSVAEKDAVIQAGLLAHQWPALPLSWKRDRNLSNLTNVGMMMRPDLFDPAYRALSWFLPVFHGV